MKNILVTGCNGQLGRAVNRVLGVYPELKLINTDVPGLDICDIDSVMKLARNIKPAAIINCAAQTNVNGCETDPDTAFKINAIGPRNLAIAARDTGAKLFQISTDYVFSGDDGRHYKETDKVGPKSEYGRTKLAGEDFVREFADRYFILRTAWMYGEGKNFVKTMLSLSETRDEVEVVEDQFGTPTWSMELARCIENLLFTDNYGIFHATCQGECNWAQLAREVFRLKGLNTKVTGVTTTYYNDKYPGQADRPMYSVLDNTMLDLTGAYKFREWHEALEMYLKEV